jgi:lipoprotein-anchoring transpeptidase ErfK/SrfK
MRRAILPALVALALFATACGTSAAETTAVRGESPVPETTTTTSTTQAPPDPSRWDVEIATAIVPIVDAQCRLPLDLDPAAPTTPPLPPPITTNGCHDPGAPEGKPILGAIPGSVANVGSAQISGGWSFNNPTYFDNPLVFLVVENHGEWLEVMVPTRPNQQTGWIRSSDVNLSTTRWHGEVNVVNNTLQVWNGDELVFDTGTVDGAARSPTPLGRFYVNEIVMGTPTGSYGSYAFSTNAYSNDLEQFDGGLPVFAVHGTSNPGQIGSDISNGCVRIPNEVIEQMATQVPAGTPIQVVA